jgi:hypothetical protein
MEPLAEREAREEPLAEEDEIWGIGTQRHFSRK